MLFLQGSLLQYRIMRIEVSTQQQTLTVLDDDGELVAQYPVSTALNGVGQVKGSYQTPLGRHIIRAKIGADAEANTVFVGRRPTGETWSPELGAEHPGRDWMLTRILWLSGCEPGFNRLGNVDTMQRYVYIHGAPDTAEMGKIGSHGCVRMHNDDVIALFDMVPTGTTVLISDE